jgi:hypothetical protein
MICLHRFVPFQLDPAWKQSTPDTLLKPRNYSDIIATPRRAKDKDKRKSKRISIKLKGIQDIINDEGNQDAKVPLISSFGDYVCSILPISHFSLS